MGWTHLVRRLLWPQALAVHQEEYAVLVRALPLAVRVHQLAERRAFLDLEEDLVAVLCAPAAVIRPTARLFARRVHGGVCTAHTPVDENTTLTSGWAQLPPSRPATSVFRRAGPRAISTQGLERTPTMRRRPTHATGSSGCARTTQREHRVRAALNPRPFSGFEEGGRDACGGTAPAL